MPFIPKARLLNVKLRWWMDFFPNEKVLCTSTPPPMSIKSILRLEGVLFPGGHHSIYLSFVASEHFVLNNESVRRSSFRLY